MYQRPPRVLTHLLAVRGRQAARSGEGRNREEPLLYGPWLPLTERRGSRVIRTHSRTRTPRNPPLRKVVLSRRVTEDVLVRRPSGESRTHRSRRAPGRPRSRRVATRILRPWRAAQQTGRPA